MGLSDDLKKEVATIFSEQWAISDGDKVPEAEDLKLSNDAVKLDATILYTDLSESTKLVDGFKPHFASEVYKSFLHCAAKIVKSRGGTITAYDGDRLMAVFIGGYKNTNAAKAALMINWARIEIINPAVKKQYPDSTYSLNHVTGVDTCNVFTTRTGVRGANDLVWVGKAANHAAKLCTLSHDYPSRITEEVYKEMNDEAKTSNGTDMWEKRTWTGMGRIIYRSSWRWDPSK
jgi:class 3 adenylate cyclase